MLRIESIDVSIEELTQLVEAAGSGPIPAEGVRKLKAAVDTLGAMTKMLEQRTHDSSDCAPYCWRRALRRSCGRCATTFRPPNLPALPRPDAKDMAVAGPELTRERRKCVSATPT